MSGQQGQHSVSQLAAGIVAAYVSKNRVPAADLPALLRSVHRVMHGLVAPRPQPEVRSKPVTPAGVKRSITPDALISFLDGKPYKTLKRHLGRHGLDPHSYRERYGLPKDYPMLAPSYAAQRSKIAKAIGLRACTKPAATSVKPEPVRKRRAPRKAKA
ncbi:MucR family transcriptional regulator [Methylobacterium longum]|uniref:MucR family transcriptional regulator n=1 Tax=Methylobacterium longum TaxID=767694 RepID=A0ABT8AM09_9HYPH|nr:MucR family transcriptional regulator [Methylobacterium longum]MDN3570511.1 MucR family transcriptional regulator [Methylobacterium longum]